MAATSTSPAGTARRISWPAIAGIVFAVLFVVGLLVGGATPDYDAPDEEWVSWFDDSSNRTPQVIAMFATVLSALAFVVFLSGLTHRLRRSGSTADVAITVCGGAGLLFAGATIVAGVAINQVSAAMTFGGDDYPVPGADVLRQAEQVGFGIGLLGGGLAAALVVASASIAARGTSTFPNWLVITGYVVAVLLLLSVFFLPLALFVLWVLAVSIVMLRRPMGGVSS